MSLKDPNVLNATAKKRVAIVIANAATSTTTGWPVGFWWSELSHPYHVFAETGYEVEVFSPEGGPCTADGMSDPNDASGYSKSDLISQGFIHTPELKRLVDNTKKVADLNVAEFDAILVAGGQAPMFTFERATALHQKFAAFHEAGKVAAALCHGVAILAYAKGTDGQYRVCQR
jgi:putative intracellular protease/amidase